MMVKLGKTFLCLIGILALGISSSDAQQSENYRLQAWVAAQSHGEGVSDSFRQQASTLGQPVTGSAVAGSSGIDSGFINEQLFDLSAPSTPVVIDGFGADSDRTTDASQLCASWLTQDTESGIFAAWLRVGSTPGAGDQVPATSVGPVDSACIDGPFARCMTYFMTLESRNGSGLRSASGGSDGIFVDDPVDSDGDDLGDECDPDDDGDGIADIEDDCPCDPLNDLDEDGHCDNLATCAPDDNCPDDFNPGQRDGDGDGRGDACADDCRVYVDDDGGAGVDCGEIQDCVERARSNCRVLVAPGLYTQNLVIETTLQIEGEAGAEQTLLDVSGGDPAVRIERSGAAVHVRIVGLGIAGDSGGLLVRADTEIVDSRIAGAGTGVQIAEDMQGDTPRLELLRTTVEAVSTGVWAEVGTVVLRESVIDGCDVGARVDSGKLILDRSWIRDSTDLGVEMVGGRLELRNGLVTDSGNACVLIEPSASADLEFATVVGCGTGVELQNASTHAVSIRRSIVYGNTGADLVGVDCAQMQSTDTTADCCGLNDNLCANPMFANAGIGNYHLTLGSPCVDSALDPDAFSGSPCVDHDGSPRLLDGDHDGIARADMGALELDPADLSVSGDIVGLRFLDPTTLVWEPDPGSSRYLVFVAPLSGVDYHAPWDCLATTNVAEYMLPVHEPPTLGGLLYLIAGEDEGGQRGSLSDGTCAERSNDAVCP